MKNLSCSAKFLLALSLSLPQPYIFATATIALCSEYTHKTLDALEHTTEQAKKIASNNQSLITMGDQVCDTLITLGKSEEVKNIFTPEKTNHIKQIVDDHVHNIKAQVDIFLKEGIDPEVQLMQQRIDDLLKEDKEKLKDLSRRVKTTIDEFLKDQKVQDSLKTIKAESKKLEAHFKKFFK